MQEGQRDSEDFIVPMSSVQHIVESGLGFERAVMFCTGMANIRDVIPFPRSPGSASF